MRNPLDVASNEQNTTYILTNENLILGGKIFSNLRFWGRILILYLRVTNTSWKRPERVTNAAKVLQIYVNCSTINIQKQIFLHMECGRIYELFRIPRIFFHVRIFLNIPRKSRIWLWKHCGRIYVFFHITYSCDN